MYIDLKCGTPMRVKSALCVFIQFVFVFTMCGQDAQFCRSQVVEGLYFGISCFSGSGVATNDTPIDGELVIGFWVTTNDFSVYVPSEPAYVYQIALFNSNGVAMPKTASGEKFGEKYFSLDASVSKAAAAKPVEVGWSRLHAEGMGSMTYLASIPCWICL